MKKTPATIIKEFGPFPGTENVAGVTFDGTSVWWASGERLNASDPSTGEIQRFLEVPAKAGTAFDGRFLYQTSAGQIRKVDPETGEVVHTIPAPTPDDSSGLAWAEGSLWVGQADGHRILKLDPETGAVLREIKSERVVTGVSWVDGELWHGTWEETGESDVRRIDPETGDVLESLEMPAGVGVSGLESDGRDRFFCGGGSSGKLRVIRRPAR